jgi:AcrR family transcriptional regulator
MSSTQTDTRERILKESWRLLAANRGKNVRLEDIAKAAEVSRQAVYLHFHSRPELLIATVRYVDEALGLVNRIEPFLEACRREDGLAALDAFVEFWGNYIPEIYGLAKALLAVQETDAAAAAAWKDRMDDLYSGCRGVVEQLQREGRLAPEWSIEEASDLFWTSLSIATWDHLTVERRWTKAQYIQGLQRMMRRVLLK